MELRAITPDNPLRAVCHASHFARIQLFGNVAFGSEAQPEVPMILIEAPGEADSHRSLQEIAMGAVWKQVVRNVRPGDIETLARRENKVNDATVKYLGAIARRVFK